MIYQRLAKVFLIRSSATFCRPAKAGPITTGRCEGHERADPLLRLHPRQQRHGTLYIGVCNDIRARLQLHRTDRGSQFVKEYGVMRLVYIEDYASPTEASQREKQTA